MQHRRMKMCAGNKRKIKFIFYPMFSILPNSLMKILDQLAFFSKTNGSLWTLLIIIYFQY